MSPMQMPVQRFLLFVDNVSTWCGKIFAWLIIVLTVVVCAEVFKRYILIAGALVLLQGLAEIVRCVICLRTGEWPARLKDAEEIDVVEEQLAGSIYVDEESRQRAIERVHEIDEAA